MGVDLLSKGVLRKIELQEAVKFGRMHDKVHQIHGAEPEEHGKQQTEATLHMLGGAHATVSVCAWPGRSRRAKGEKTNFQIDKSIGRLIYKCWAYGKLINK